MGSIAAPVWVAPGVGVSDSSVGARLDAGSAWQAIRAEGIKTVGSSGVVLSTFLSGPQTMVSQSGMLPSLIIVLTDSEH